MAKASRASKPTKKVSNRAFTSVASASPKKRQRKRRGPMNDNLVKRYVTEVAAALGEKQFEALFAKLTDDIDVGQDEAIALTSIILDAPVAPSTTRGAALKRILKLHNSLATFKLKQRAVGGRSAA